MRLAALFRKTMIENFRDWKILSLTLVFSPFFVLLMYFYLGTASKTYNIGVVNRDAGCTEKSGTQWNAGLDLLEKMSGARTPDGVPILNVIVMRDTSEILKPLIERTVDLSLVIPDDLSRVLMEYRNGRTPAPTKMTSLGDPANPRYITAAAYCDYLSYEFASAVTGQKSPLEIKVESVGGTKSLNDFELYIPALLALALMMLMFTTAATIIREKDKGTLVRLQMSRMRVHEFLSAVSLTQLIIGVLAMGLTFVTAWALGYRTTGSWSAVMAVGLLSSVSVIAVSLVVAAYLRTIFDLLTIGCFPFFILMFFSGGMIPLPPLSLFSIAGRSINANDILPTTHAISALNKILNFGSGLGGVRVEMGFILALTVVYCLIGIYAFNRRHLRAR
jgi:ABC-2 type transport system permease protein